MYRCTQTTHTYEAGPNFCLHYCTYVVQKRSNTRFARSVNNRNETRFSAPVFWYAYFRAQRPAPARFGCSRLRWAPPDDDARPRGPLAFVSSLYVFVPIAFARDIAGYDSPMSRSVNRPRAYNDKVRQIVEPTYLPTAFCKSSFLHALIIQRYNTFCCLACRLLAGFSSTRRPTITLLHFSCKLINLFIKITILRFFHK